MDRIFIKPLLIELELLRLEVLKNQAGSSIGTPPATVGGGKSINQIEALCDVYSEIEKQLVILITSTTGFLKKAKETYVNTDKKIAEMYKK